MTSSEGQAQIELIASIPLLAIVAAVILQLFSLGYTQSLADGAVEGAALAVAGGADGPGVTAAARRALPSWAQERLRLVRTGGELALRLRPPTLIPGLGRWLEVDAHAWVREPR